MKVEIELDDLERLVFATAVIKSIEGLLVARKADPFVQPHLNYSAAVDAATTAMNHARRGTKEASPGWNAPLNKDEVAFLKKWFYSQKKVPEVLYFTSAYREAHDELDSLASKGCIILGQCVDAIVWPGVSTTQLLSTKSYAVKLTNRAYPKYEAATKE